MTETPLHMNNLYLYHSFFIAMLYFNMMNQSLSVRECVLDYCPLISLPCVYYPQLDTLHFFFSGSSNVVILFIHPVVLRLPSQCILTGTWEIMAGHKLMVHFSNNSVVTSWKIYSFLTDYIWIYSFPPSPQGNCYGTDLWWAVTTWALSFSGSIWVQTFVTVLMTSMLSDLFPYVCKYELVCSFRKCWNIEEEKNSSSAQELGILKFCSAAHAYLALCTLPNLGTKPKHLSHLFDCHKGSSFNYWKKTGSSWGPFTQL